ncbi:winged helix-turn-helix domain-containing protein [Bradyrhizobium sp. CB82]|uniref:winged helix-turn-helix domain-containing tetratricopeptide repeat protein n=1 Tax=Bradyrhizobium sp. CB82 TaxID=3039159 RepID=UPI0024B25187|nr:winged helix-turn-helix domain-containing protein [Bradyrhizobium sp. CB82]WFU44803.1 winged helix-turn-helix domain-containing protein [Bradyrhizobium sp. CB82]
MACLRLNGYTLDLDQAQLFDLHGHAVELRPQALAVLLELGRRHGELVTKRDLSARVWPGVSVTDDSLVQCVVEIRRALGDTRQQVVRTMPRRGYLLIVDAADTKPHDVQKISVYRLAAILVTTAVAILLVWQFVLPTVAPGRREAHDGMVADVAVLPLRVLNASREGSPDGNGLAYMIASDLARNPDLHIVSPLATAELRGKNLSPAQIAAMTHARYLVDGSAERRGDRLQLHVQLIASGDSRIVWSGRFEPTAQDLPEVTEALISRISASLGATVRESDRAALRSRAPASLDAHARVLRAIALTIAPSPEGLREARQELEQAVRLDPNYAPAWAHLGQAKTLLIFGHHDPGLGRQDLPQAIADIEHAIALDPLLASSWRVLSVAIDSSQNPEAAVSAAERATELGPGDPDNWLVFALAQHHAGRTQAAIEAFEKAISWSPLRPPQYAGVGARLRYSVQDYENAMRFARECMDRMPALGVCKAIWLSSLVRTGHAVEAESAWPTLVAAAPSLQAYRMTPHNTPMALSVDEDLDRLRKSNARAMAQ